MSHDNNIVNLYGGFTPKPPTAERGGADFWCVGLRFAPLCFFSRRRHQQGDGVLPLDCRSE